MNKKQVYTPAKVKIIYLERVDVITTSGFETVLPEGEWDKEM